MLSPLGLDAVEKDLNQVVFHAGTASKDGKVVTSGGRVLANVAMANNLQTAAAEARKGAEAIQFEGAFFRRDIAKRGCDHLQANRCVTGGQEEGEGSKKIKLDR